MTLRVLHLTGSAVSGFYADLSRLYAGDCLAATADPARYSPVVAHVTPDRRWRFPVDLSDAAIAAAEPVDLPEALRRVVALDVDVVLPQMFCLPGMTAYRGLLDVLGLPYVGNTPSVMAATADKAVARALVAAAGVDVPPGVVVRREDVDRAATDLPLAPPLVVKPVDADNSLGLALVRSPEELGPALAAALEHSPAALVERYVELGREVRCGVLERDGELVALPLEEYRVDATIKPVRPHEDKIRRAASGDLELVAKDTDHAWLVDTGDPVTAAVHRLARRCHVALGCRDYSLVDVRVDPDGRPWFLEASLYSSFAEQSVLTVMAAAAGTPLRELFATAVETAVRRGGSTGGGG